MSNTNVVGVGEYAVSKSPETTIKTFALGSCVAVIFLHKPTRTIGLIHIALPESSISPDIVQTRPGYFADTGIPAILREMAACSGAGKGITHGMMVKIAGGANVLDTNNLFNIGKRNVLALKKILWPLGMGPVAEDVGGSYSRTVSVSVATGVITLSCPAKGEWNL